MEVVESVFCNLLQRFLLWIPQRTQQQYPISRDFWMPDESCRVCYECEVPFSLFNRRHHCRICGRIFCAKCTQNTVPPAVIHPDISYQAAQVRACNFCFKLKQEDENRSNVSLSSAGTHNTKSIPENGEKFHSPRGSSATAGIEDITEQNQQRIVHHGNGNFVSVLPREREMSPNPYDFCGNRSDEEETDDSKKEVRGSLWKLHGHQTEMKENDVIEKPVTICNNVSEYFVADNARNCGNRELNLHHGGTWFQECAVEMVTTPRVERSLSKRSTISSDDYEGLDESLDESNFYAPSSLPSSTLECHDVDVENNIAIWVPPPPQDEADERATYLADDDDDDDDDDNEIGWGNLTSSEYRNKEKATAMQDQRRAMRAVVDGHFKALVAQLLEGEGLDAYKKEGTESNDWLEIVPMLATQAAKLIKPDTSRGGGMDPGGYVKIRCVASGQRSDSRIVKGVVCKRNVAHRRMASHYNRPKLLLLGGALEYQRVPNMLSSLDTLIQQEKEHISMTISRIEAHHPNVVLVEKNVSGQAQEILLSKGVALVLNVKRPLLEHIARCTGAEVVPAPDHLTKAKTGYCDLFHVEKFIEEHGTAGQSRQPPTRTLMFFEGCPRPLGCTVLLKGASGDELKKVKRVIQFAIFAAYQLALETSFLVDEGADLSLKSPISVALPDNHPKFDRSITIVPRLLLPESVPIPTVSFQNQSVSSFLEHDASVNIPSCSNANVNSNGAIISTPMPIMSSSFSSRNNSPSTSPRAIGGEQTIEETLSNKKSCTSNSGLNLQVQNDFHHSYASISYEVTPTKQVNSGKYGSSNGFHSVTMPHRSRLKPYRSTSSIPGFSEGRATSEDQTASVNSRYMYQRSRSMAYSTVLSTTDEQEANQEEFPPSPSDQSILVLFSSICLRKRVVCQRGHLFRIKYYGSFDKPLGKFLKDNVFDHTNGCGACGETRDAHIHCYMHQQGSLIISVHHQDQVLPGEGEEKIWMWHRCLICPRVNNVPPATHRVLMSDAAWGLSFGKFLELSFSSHAAAGRVAACGHSLHRDCLRFYGFGDMIACFRYGSINVHTVCLPPAKLEFNNPESSEWLHVEVCEVEKKANYIYTKALNTLCAIEGKMTGHVISKCPEGRRCIIEFIRLLKSDHKAFLEVMQSAAPMKRESGYLYADILQLNAARRRLANFSYAWNEQFNTFLKLQQMSLTSSSASLEEPLTPLKTKDISYQYISSSMVEDHELASVNTVSEPNEGVDPHLSDMKYQQRLLQLDNKGSGGMGDYGMNHFCDSSNKAFHVFQEAYGRNEALYKIVQAIDEGSVGTENRLFSSKSDIQFNIQECEFPIQRTWSEGKASSFRDLPYTFATAWTGEGHTIEAHKVNISSSGQEISSQGLGIDRPASVHDIPTVLNSEAASESSQDLDSRHHSYTSWLGSDSLSSTSHLYKSNSSISESTGMSATASHLIYSSCGSEGHLLLPLGIHDTVIPVYDNEPTSIIAYAIMSHQYHAHLSDEPLEKDIRAPDREMQAKHENLDLDLSSVQSVLSHSFQSIEGSLDKSNFVNEAPHTGSKENGNQFCPKATHVKVVFTDNEPPGKVKYMVTCYYAKRFDTLRKACCLDEMDFIRSLCRCKKWGAQGGKSNVFFAKTKDDRLVIKQVTKTELESFIKFAPEYFKYVSESLKSGSPTCLAKILGIFQVSVKHAKGGREVRTDLMVMENLLYGRHISRVYDLKGSLRCRYNSDKTGKNTVLLDENLVESMLTNPLFIGNKAKRLLERAVWNDTSFLASVDVMDYSLLVGVDDLRGELVLGIIDFMRQYTWDKHLETWVKASGILGGPKNAQPTVISPKQYKKRFRKAMKNYFLMVPDQWSPTMEIFCPPPHPDSTGIFQSIL